MRISRSILLDVATTGLVAIALVTLVHDRVLPALADRARVDPGDRAGEVVRLRAIGTGVPVVLDAVEPSLVVVFRSTCPVCEETAPDWARLARLAPRRVFAVGLESDTAAAAWVADRLSGVVAVSPLDASEFVDRLRIRAVPTTLLFEGERLVLSRIGPLQDDDRARIRRAFSGPVAHEVAAAHSLR